MKSRIGSIMTGLVIALGICLLPGMASAYDSCESNKDYGMSSTTKVAHACSIPVLSIIRQPVGLSGLCRSILGLDEDENQVEPPERCVDALRILAQDTLATSNPFTEVVDQSSDDITGLVWYTLKDAKDNTAVLICVEACQEEY